MSPSYKNINKCRKTINGKVIEPNEIFESLGYLDENTVELVKIKETPYFNSTIFSGKITEATEIKIPEKDEFKNWIAKYSIHFFIEKGEVKIAYNNKGNIPELHLYTSARWNIRCFNREIDKLIIDGQNFCMYLIIERL